MVAASMALVSQLVLASVMRPAFQLETVVQILKLLAVLQV